MSRNPLQLVCKPASSLLSDPLALPPYKGLHNLGGIFKVKWQRATNLLTSVLNSKI